MCPTGPLRLTPYGNRYTAYPNPADDALTVEQTDSASSPSPAAPRPAAASSSPAPSTPYTVRLYDNQGTLQLQQSTTTPTVQVPTSGLPTGLYLLHIVERRQVQITH